MAHIDMETRDESDGVVIGQSRTAQGISMMYDSFDSDDGTGNDWGIKSFDTVSIPSDYGEITHFLLDRKVASKIHNKKSVGIYDGSWTAWGASASVFKEEVELLQCM